MSTFIERIQEAVACTATAQAASKEAAELDKKIKQRIKNNEEAAKLLKIASLVTGIPVVDPLDPELEQMQIRLDALWDRARQARLRLTLLERAQTEHGSVHLISSSANRKTAQIVIHYLLDNGKKASFTRHCQITDQGYAGLSTISAQKVFYRPAETVAEAA